MGGGVKIKIFSGTLLLGILAFIGIYAENINPQAMFNYQSYFRGGYSWGDRMIFLSIALVICILLFILLYGSRNLIMGALGRNSIYIFINHGLIFWFLREDMLFAKLRELSLLSLSIVSISLVTFCICWFANEYIRKLLNYIYSLPLRASDTLVRKKSRVN